MTRKEIDLEKIIIDLGNLKLTGKEFIDTIEEERKRVLNSYGVTTEYELLQLYKNGLMSYEEYYRVMMHLHILDEMKQCVYEEIGINNYLIHTNAPSLNKKPIKIY